MSVLVEKNSILKICRKCSAEFAGMRCKACAKTRSIAWSKANPDKVKVSSAAWKKANSEKIKEADKNRYASNPEIGRAKSAAWRIKNQDSAKARHAAWYAANRDKRKANVAAWKIANPDVVRIHWQNYRARKRSSGGKLSNGLAEKLFSLQKGKCACCKKPLGNNYHLDHIMPLARGGSNTDDNIQLLRQPCNLQKHAKDPIEFMQSRGLLL
jgi:5-methylcytosine-specific restriction endonuclease McrA